MAAKYRVNPTLFDKIVGGMELDGLTEEGPSGVSSRDTMRAYFLPKMERFNEEALRLTVRRELAWLLNTTNLGAVVDLDPYPHVQTSVLNYGVPDLAGKAISRRTILQRAREIRAAIRAFEPRIEQKTLMVEPVEQLDRDNTVTYIIQGDVTSAVNAMPVKFRTEVEPDTASVTIRD